MNFNLITHENVFNLLFLYFNVLSLPLNNNKKELKKHKDPQPILFWQKEKINK